MRSAARLLPLLLIPILALAGDWSLRLAWADHLSRPADPATIARAPL